MSEPIMRGKFALYDDHGGYLLAFEDELGGDGQTQHLAIPAALVQIARARAEGKRITPKMLMGLAGLGSGGDL